MSQAPVTIEAYMTRSVHFIDYRDRVSHAHRAMERYSIRHLPVLHEGKLVGILSERDVHWTEALFEKGLAEDMEVSQAMTPLPYAVTRDAPLAQVAREMAQQKFGAAVVMEGGAVLGVFTTTDALRALADALEGRSKS
jgi:acetoin utilization protein AcuB